MANQQTIKNFFSMYSKGAVRMEISFNDGTSAVYSDYDFLSMVMGVIKKSMADDIVRTYCKERKPRVKKNEEGKEESK